MQSLAINLINFYQKYLSFDTGALKFLVPGGACRYPLRCSEYTKGMIAKYGVVKGSLFGIRRILSCI